MKARTIEQFNDDVTIHGGYLYTITDKLSCRLSNQRTSEAILSLANVRGKRVIDIGCGDGTYTLGIAQAGARTVLGIDAATSAIECARANNRSVQNLHFAVQDIAGLHALREHYDIAIVRGVLHHLPVAEVPQAVSAICNVATDVIVVEPNGYNPVLKLIERLSAYHRRHGEKSYWPHRLDRWFIACGATVERSPYIGLVPFFCPEFLARMLKSIEPLVERTPLLRTMCCGQYVQKIKVVR